MDLLEKTQKLCKEFKINPARSKGQNFLINNSVYKKIVEASNITSKDNIIEVGPGLGMLTKKLSGEANKVLAVELDDIICNYLIGKFKDTNVKVLNKNVLDDLPITENYLNIYFGGQNYKVVANLPYNITSIFLRKLLASKVAPLSITLMLQKEVVERLMASPGKMNILAISVQLYCDLEFIDAVPKNNFWPEPKVDSAIIKLIPRQKYAVDEKRFFQIVKIGFSAKRKKLKNNLSAGLRAGTDVIEKILATLDFNPNIRAQELSIEDWLKLVEKLSKCG